MSNSSIGTIYKLNPEQSLSLPVSFEFIYVIESSDSFNIRFADGSVLPFESGVKQRFNEIQNLMYIENPHDKTIFVKIIVGYGDYSNDSTRVNGTIKTYSNDVKYTDIVFNEFTFDEYGKISFDAMPYEKVVIQNTSEENIRIFSQAGLRLVPMGDMQLNYSGTISIFGTAGDTIVIGGFK